jgi:hypothetical protein
VAVGGELLLPDHGAAGLLSRAAALALIPAVLWVAGFVRPHERARIAAAVRARRGAARS